MWIPHPEDNTPIEAPPTSVSVAAAHHDGNHTSVTSTRRQLPTPLSETPARRARPRRSRGVRAQDASPRHKERRAKPLDNLAQQPSYHALPTIHREYFDQVVTNLRNGAYLASPQSLEPTVGSATGFLLIGPRRLTGPGAAAASESVYAVLVDRPSEGAYVCWICGETRADRRLLRALDHVRGHFNHRPYHCSEIHLDQHTEQASPPPLASVW